MLPRIFLSDDDTRNTKCARCKNYLSVPPICICLNDMVCGRCTKECGDIEKNRAYFYEDLAKFMFFPCKNDIYGCSVQVPWGEVLDHESRCKFDRIICPAMGCESKIGSEQVLHHFKVNHEHDILKENEYQFSLQEKTLRTNKLFIWNNYPFIISIKTIKGKIYFEVSCLKELSTENLKLKCVLSSKICSNSICLTKLNLTKYDSKFLISSNKEELDISALRNILGPQITCVINFENEDKTLKCAFNSNKMLSELECPICTDYMLPPIYMCSTGHSLCGLCKTKLSKCPSCDTDFSEARNYSLEKISEIVTYPCKYKHQGCDFVANHKDITFHEVKCPYSCQNNIRCFLNNTVPCTWTGSYEKIFQHIFLLHPDYCIQLGCSISIDVSTFKMKNWFFLYDRKIFKLYLDYNKFGTNRIRWNISHIDNTEEVCDKYMFYLDILSDNRIFTTSEICHNTRISVDPTKEKNGHYINMPIALLNNFIKKNILSFKLYVTATCPLMRSM